MCTILYAAQESETAEDNASCRVWLHETTYVTTRIEAEIAPSASDSIMLGLVLLGQFMSVLRNLNDSYRIPVVVADAQSCLTLCNPVNGSTPGCPVLHYLPELLKFMSTESVMPSNHLILCHPLLPLPIIFPKSRVFSQ